MEQKNLQSNNAEYSGWKPNNHQANSYCRMKELFWNLRKTLRREKTLVCGQRNINHSLWSYMPRIRHEYEHSKMAYANNAERQHWNDPRRASE